MLSLKIVLNVFEIQQMILDRPTYLSILHIKANLNTIHKLEHRPTIIEYSTIYKLDISNGHIMKYRAIKTLNLNANYLVV